MSTADFIERRWPAGFITASEAIEDATASLKQRGATFFRTSMKSVTKEIVVEGWRVFPNEQGDLPL